MVVFVITGAMAVAAPRFLKARGMPYTVLFRMTILNCLMDGQVATGAMPRLMDRLSLGGQTVMAV